MQFVLGIIHFYSWGGILSDQLFRFKVTNNPYSSTSNMYDFFTEKN